MLFETRSEFTREEKLYILANLALVFLVLVQIVLCITYHMWIALPLFCIALFLSSQSICRIIRRPIRSKENQNS